MAALAATGVAGQARAEGPHDETLLYLKARFFALAAAMSAAAEVDKSPLYQRMVELAAAMSVIPGGMAGATAKSDVANWSTMDAGCVVRLPAVMTWALRRSPD
ncbi:MULTISPECIES: hypothetical protein [unclassified Rhizobium]|uniref:hypothetical protein n=1 Tax=unclassified Rhizobium TaxID=2613769 RepID=UPI001ADD2461|nr:MULTISPECIES: hypothetical protein [unclassified Rhizobium]MBO9125437.1 hypothetical protein [Rhizobium sp. 16-488-2b]MBO9176022.1 hypothetical protein [Rhizobium sp. 16-488-2a]